MVWGRVSVPKGKKLRFRIRIKLNKCQTGVASLDVIAAAYVADSQGTIQCLSQPQGPAVKVKTPPAKYPLGPCPGAAPGPQGSTILAENQAFSGAGDPNARRGRRSRRSTAWTFLSGPSPSRITCPTTAAAGTAPAAKTPAAR